MWPITSTNQKELYKSRLNWSLSQIFVNRVVTCLYEAQIQDLIYFSSFEDYFCKMYTADCGHIGVASECKQASPVNQTSKEK